MSTEKPSRMSRLRRVVLGLLLLIVLVVAGVVILIDPLARSMVQRGGTYALGVDTTLDHMDIELLAGKAEVTALTVSNPEGFDTPHFFRLDDGQVSVSLGSLTGDKVVVPELALSGIRMNLERKGDRANYKVILDNLKRFESRQDDTTDKRPEPPTAEPPAEKEGRTFVIQKLDIRDVQVQVDLLSIGGKPTRIPVKVDRIEMENVGSDADQGPLIMQLTAIIIKSILTAVTQEAGDLIPGDVLAELDQGLQQLKGLGDVTTHLKKQVDDLGHEVGQAGDKIGKQLEDVGQKIGDSLGDLLNPDKNKSDDPR